MADGGLEATLSAAVLRCAGHRAVLDQRPGYRLSSAF
jgi:hypothetical protein